MIVVKVGGSLYDLPDLGDRLRRFLATLTWPVQFRSGGGITADADLREFEYHIHRLGDEADVAGAGGVQRQRHDAGDAAAGDADRRRADRRCRDSRSVSASPLADEGRPDHLPHHWDVCVTPTRWRLRAAQVFAAERVRCC